MFKLDYIFVNLILDLFPWKNYDMYGFGIYAKFLLLLLFAQQVFIVVYAAKNKEKRRKEKC